MKFSSSPLHRLVMLVVVSALSATATLAGPFSQIVSFGDSLSDVGNKYLSTNGSTPDPSDFWEGRYSNGEVWVEQFASLLGMTPATASLAGGTNYAYGGYTTSQVFSTVATYLGNVDGTADPEALYTVWAGGNDFIDNVQDLSTIGESVAGWAGNVSGTVSTLHDAGARRFLVLDLPPLGDTPAGRIAALLSGSDLPDLINGYVEDFNTQLSSNLEFLADSDSTYDIRTVDIYSLFNELAADPSAYGLENVTDAAQHASGADAGKYLFWDLVHPTTVGHSFVAAAAASVVPEPSMLTLLLIVAMTGGVCRARRRYR